MKVGQGEGVGQPGPNHTACRGPWERLGFLLRATGQSLGVLNRAAVGSSFRV